MHRQPPLGVVVVAVERVGGRPRAAGDAVVADHGSGHAPILPPATDSQGRLRVRSNGRRHPTRGATVTARPTGEVSCPGSSRCSRPPRSRSAGSPPRRTHRPVPPHRPTVRCSTSPTSRRPTAASSRTRRTSSAARRSSRPTARGSPRSGLDLHRRLVQRGGLHGRGLRQRRQPDGVGPLRERLPGRVSSGRPTRPRSPCSADSSTPASCASPSTARPPAPSSRRSASFRVEGEGLSWHPDGGSTGLHRHRARRRRVEPGPGHRPGLRRARDRGYGQSVQHPPDPVRLRVPRVPGLRVPLTELVTGRDAGRGVRVRRTRGLRDGDPHDQPVRRDRQPGPEGTHRGAPAAHRREPVAATRSWARTAIEWSTDGGRLLYAYGIGDGSESVAEILTIGSGAVTPVGRRVLPRLAALPDRHLRRLVDAPPSRSTRP